MKKSKKGVTLVELVICCAIIVMLGGACTAVLISGEKVFSGSANSANSQIEANVLQTYLMTAMPSVKTVATIDEDDAKAATAGVYLFFDGEDFTINDDGKLTVINGVKEFKCKFLKAGEATSSDAKAQFAYTVKMNDGNSFSSGLVLSNMPYDLSTMGTQDASGVITPIEYDLKTTPAAFDIPSGS